MGSAGLRRNPLSQANVPVESKLALLVLLLLTSQGLASNACQDEMASACPDRPGSEMGRCLKDKEEHDKPTEISSECTDFIALNVACADEISKFCDESFFTDDTVLCLAEWTPRQNLGDKCAKVVKWAAPQKDGEGPTDELGLSEKDYAEKRKWQADRKAGRGAAIEKMREDKRKDEELATMKREDPEGYKQLLKEREEAKRSYEELKKRKRLLAAAEDRKLKEEMGEETEEQREQETQEDKKIKRRQRKMQEAQKSGWLPYALGACALAFVAMNVLNYFSKEDKDTDKDD